MPRDKSLVIALHCLSYWAITVHWIFCKQRSLPGLARLPLLGTYALSVQI